MPPKLKTHFVLFLVFTFTFICDGSKSANRLPIRDGMPTSNSSSDDSLFEENDTFLEIIPKLHNVLNEAELESSLMAVLFECFVRNIYGLSLEQLCPVEIDGDDLESSLSHAARDLFNWPGLDRGNKVKNESRIDPNSELKSELPKTKPTRNEKKFYDEFKRKSNRTKNEQRMNQATTEVDGMREFYNKDRYEKHEQDNETDTFGSLELGQELHDKMYDYEENNRQHVNYEQEKNHHERSSPTGAQFQQNLVSRKNIEREIRSHPEQQYLDYKNLRTFSQHPPSHHHLTRRGINALPLYQHSKSNPTQSGLPTQPPDDLYLQVPDLIRHYGYSVEVHDIRTTDDYILTLHRIVGTQQDGSERGNRNSTAKQKTPVLLVHGFASSSADFVIGGPDSALGFMLADAGYDVWLGNFRGNSYSTRHTTLSRDQAEYWRFSLDDLARRDVPAMVDHILKTAHRPKIFYIGHSIGATVLPMTCFLKPDFAQKILHFSAMAPIGFGKMSRGPVKVMTNLARITYKHKEEGGGAKAQVLSRDRTTVAVMFFFCGARSIFWKLCLTLLTSAGGRNTGLFNKEMLSLVLANFPAGTSVRLAAHVGQLLSTDGLQKFDFKEDGNQELYKQTSPLEYDLRYTKCPTAVYWAQNDYLAPPQDVEQMMSSLPNVTEKMLVGHETFNHFDFVYSNQARHLVHTDLIKTMQKYDKR